MSSIIHMVLTTPSLSPHTLSLRHSPSTPTLNMPSSLLIHMPHIHSTHSTHSTHNTHNTHSTPKIHNTNSPPHSTLIHNSHNRSTLTLLIHSTPSSTRSTPSHPPSTNSIHARHSLSILTNSTRSIPHSTHMDTPHRSTLTLSTHMALPNKDNIPNIHIPSILSTHNTHSTRNTRTTPSIHVTRHPTIAEGLPEDPHMLVTAPPRTREEKRALRCAGQAERLTADQVMWDLSFV
ncbi:unnamed protein product [Scomber scombrus]|uniref:Unnamed protein product n=1 Tax=Scomber scombrus TaxID=13677 RepID=A0AAV1PQ03_SCOSC